LRVLIVDDLQEGRYLLRALPYGNGHRMTKKWLWRWAR